ncbi:hypothetical protein J6590_021137 [Homalodisca vitripennis]|nr:hypothetical protein J6590_021137 [Homalodisca vitripennis]
MESQLELHPDHEHEHLHGTCDCRVLVWLLVLWRAQNNGGTGVQTRIGGAARSCRGRVGAAGAGGSPSLDTVYSRKLCIHRSLNRSRSSGHFDTP